MKKAVAHGLMSGLVLPGMGQIRNGQKTLGVVLAMIALAIFCGSIIHFGFVITDYAKQVGNFADPSYMGNTRAAITMLFKNIMKVLMLWIVPLIGVFVFSGIQAYQYAKKLEEKEAEANLPPRAPRAK